MDAFRTLIVPAAHVALARTITETLAPVGGKGMYTTGLSPDGTAPATHWISSGYIDADYAALLPLLEWTQDEENAWQKTVIGPGYPEVIFALYTQAIQTPPTNENPEPEPVISDFTLADVEALLSAVDVTTETPQQAWERLGVQLVTTDAEG